MLCRSAAPAGYSAVVFTGHACSISIRLSVRPSHAGIEELIRRWDTRTWRSYMITYLPLNYDKSVVLRNIFEVTRRSNGRRFTKNALRILLLSTFRVSSINYSLVCIVSRFIQEAPLTQRDREHIVSRNRVQELIRRWDTRTSRDVSSYLFTYLTLNYDTSVLQNIFLSRPNAYLLHKAYLMDVGLRKAPCVSCYYPLSVFLE